MDLSSFVLVVDDDPEVRELIAGFLQGHGYRVRVASGVASMNLVLEEERPDLIVLDVMMRGEDGLSAARRLAGAKGPPVIIVSALGDETDRIVGLEAGADDYLAKPCNPRELLARVRAVLRRAQSIEPPSHQEGGLYAFAGWRFDVTRRDLRDPAGIFINLSDGEFSLLRGFVDHPQRILSRSHLLDIVHGGRSDVFDRAIDTQICRLRRKLNDRSGSELIRTIRNEGYMLVSRVVRP